MPRVTKETARKLIHYAKSLKIQAQFTDPNAKSAFEFARQMASPKLKKINPKFEFEFDMTFTNAPASLTAEFADGNKWQTLTAEYTAADLRNMFFSKAEACEDVVEINIGGEDAAAGGKKGDKGGKGGKK
jgi:hypothetical protein